MIISWLVDGRAGDAEVDVERMTWMWDQTTIQDARIIERNAAGVRSAAYRPGPYTRHEGRTRRLVDDYLLEILDAHGHATERRPEERRAPVKPIETTISA